MDIASRLVFHVVHRFGWPTPRTVGAVLTVVTAALAGGALVVGHLLPASEPLIVSPLRWIGS